MNYQLAKPDTEELTNATVNSFPGFFTLHLVSSIPRFLAFVLSISDEVLQIVPPSQMVSIINKSKSDGVDNQPA